MGGHIMQRGNGTWLFNNHPVIMSTGTVGGPFEAQGQIPEAFDVLHDDMWLKKNSYETAQQKMMEEANDFAIKKSSIEKEQIDFIISGDLINQITPSTFAAKTMDAPYLGLFSACATSMEGLALAAFITNGAGANYILTGTSSHYSSTERQFRYPTEYGSQIPPTAQRTVTGAGCALVAKVGTGPIITSATLGKVIDMEMTDPFNMGGAMAPAAVDTIITHLNDRKVDISYYDLIITGDLGEVGHQVSFDLLRERGIDIKANQYVDCGTTIYKKQQNVNAGASGTASSAVGIYGHYLKKVKNGSAKKILAVATGALHSPLVIQQKKSIPCIAHAVSIEAGSDLT